MYSFVFWFEDIRISLVYVLEIMDCGWFWFVLGKFVNFCFLVLMFYVLLVIIECDYDRIYFKFYVVKMVCLYKWSVWFVWGFGKLVNLL